MLRVSWHVGSVGGDRRWPNWHRPCIPCKSYMNGIGLITGLG